MVALEGKMKSIRRARNERSILLARSDTLRILGVIILKRNWFVTNAPVLRSLSWDNLSKKTLYICIYTYYTSLLKTHPHTHTRQEKDHWSDLLRAEPHQARTWHQKNDLEASIMYSVHQDRDQIKVPLRIKKCRSTHPDCGNHAA